MKPRPAVLAAPERWEVWAGIDPGADTGLVAVRIPVAGPRAYDLEAARLVGYGTVAASTNAKLTGAEARGTLFGRVRAFLHYQSASRVVLEEPSTQTNSWRGAAAEGRATGSLFYLGAHFGLCLAAANALPWETRVWSYPPTSPARRKNKRERNTQEPVMGWMQGRDTRPMRADLLVPALRALLTQLKQRPADGLLPTLAQLRQLEPVHTVHALGVLRFHLQRERGAI